MIAGLAYGGLKTEHFNQSTHFSFNKHIAEGYGGHVTYHQELWILPLISMFGTEMAKNLIHSRLRKNAQNDHLSVYEQARETAQRESLKGVRYPTEQADYGIEVSPYEDAAKKIHTTADISFGLRSFLRMTHSREFLQQSISNDVSLKGSEYIHEISKYWNEKVKLNVDTNKYELNGF